MKKKVGIGVLVFLILVGMVFGGHTAPAGSSYATEREGVAALYQLLEAEGLPVSRWRKPYEELAREEKGGVIFLVAVGKAQGEDHLIDWIKAGNTAVVFDDADEKTNALKKSLGIGESIDATLASHFDFLRDPTLVAVSCPAELPACNEVHVVESPARVLTEAPADAVVLTSIGAKPASITFALGAGRVWYFSDSRITSNMAVDKGDHLRLLYQIAQQGDSIKFDEFHHGFVAVPEGVARDQWLAAQMLIGYLVVALVIIGASRAVRFGPPRNFHAPGHVSRQADFVAVLAMLYQEHQARGALTPYLRGWRSRVERRFGIPASCDDGERARRLTKGGVCSPDNHDRLLASLRAIKEETVAELETSILFVESVLYEPEGKHGRT